MTSFLSTKQCVIELISRQRAMIFLKFPQMFKYWESIASTETWTRVCTFILRLLDDYLIHMEYFNFFFQTRSLK